MLMINVTNWKKFYKRMTDGLAPYLNYNNGYRDGMKDADEWISTYQVEAEPVRYGRWEWFEEWSQSTPESPKECTGCGWRCGRCKVKLDDMVGWYWDDPYDKPKLNYCPNCGMKVDEQN